MIVELFTMSDAAKFAEALGIRLRVFVLEQGVPFEEELDGYDRHPATLHALAHVEGRPLGTGRFYERDAATVQVGRMAVESGERGRGVGAAILHALLAAATARAYAEARLLAQVHATPFYRRHGFEIAGAEVLDGGILHLPMARSLPAN